MIRVKPDYMLDKGVVMYGHMGKFVNFWLSIDNLDVETLAEYPNLLFTLLFRLGETGADCCKIISHFLIYISFLC
jgi:hypothetical protein